MKTIVAQVYVKKDDKILMVQENKKSIKGKWNMPAGKLEENESIIDAAVREVKEETNIDISIKGLLSIQETISSLGQLIIFYFIGEYKSGDIKVKNQEEINEVKWMSEEQISLLDKKNIRGAETIDKILDLAKKEYISLDKLQIFYMK